MTPVLSDQRERMNEAEGCVNTPRPLTHSLDLSKEGLAMKATCSIDGCDKPAKRRSWCSMHYWRWQHHGDANWEPTQITECTVEGCLTPPTNHGLCSKHRARQERTGSTDLIPRTVDYAARFWSKVDRETDGGGCWLWTSTILTSGYGQFNGPSKKVLAHRFAYELTHGPIPEGMTIDHVWNWGCRYKACVNPGHLEAVTQKENNRRARSAMRQHEEGGA